MPTTFGEGETRRGSLSRPLGEKRKKKKKKLRRKGRAGLFFRKPVKERKGPSIAGT